MKNNWDLDLLKVLFGYRRGIQTNTKFSPFMVLIGCTLKLKVDDQLCMLIQTFDEEMNVEQLIEQMITKM
jgi:hypothetical protein